MKKKYSLVAALLSTAMVASIVTSAMPVAAVSSNTMTIGSLTTEFQELAEGLEVEQPRFGWKMDSNLIGAKQTAYQIVVKDMGGKIVWDSGKQKDDCSISVRYGSTGTAQELKPESKYQWNVTVWDETGVSNTSDTSYFTTGLYGNWDGAQWIIPSKQESGAPMLRTEKSLKGKVADAQLYIASLGVYNAYLNGQEVMRQDVDGNIIDDTLNPGWTDYNSYVNYQTYDVTQYITGDAVALGVQMGKGWYAGEIAQSYYTGVIGEDDASELALLAKLSITYEDGTTEVITTNPADWKSYDNGPIIFNDFYQGEHYDARLEETVAGWNQPGFTEDNWDAVIAGEYTGAVCAANTANYAYIHENLTQRPIGGEDCYKYREDEIQKPISEGGTSEYATGNVVEYPVDVNDDITLLPGETLILDLGQNMVGVSELTISGAEGTTIQVQHAEMLNDGNLNPEMETGGSDGPKGSLYQASLRGVAAMDSYTLKGDAEETWKPSITFQGFRYVGITADSEVTIHNISGKVINSLNGQTGYIETSDSAINQLYSNVLWSQRGNYLWLPTDCPQRDERYGWSGDAQVFAGTATYNFDVASFLQNYVTMANDQAAGNDDVFGAIIPTWGGMGGGISKQLASGWSDVGVIVPWTLYQKTGDISYIKNSYPSMDAYMDAVAEKGYGKSMFGDWLNFQATAVAYMNTMYRIYTADLMKQMAEIIEDDTMVEKYTELYNTEKAAAIEKYITADGNVLSSSADGVLGTTDMHDSTYVDNSQASILWALKLGLYHTEEQKATMVQNLLTDIANKGGSIRKGQGEDTLAIGFLGVNVILPALTDAGCVDTTYDLLLQDEMPSWLYEVKNGATTIWERWNSYSKDNSFGDSSMNSFNHYSYGACVEWMYQYMAGIDTDQGEGVGFKHIILQPTIDASGRIDFVNGSYNSYYGNIVSNWVATDGSLSNYEAVIPANTNATLYLPVSEEAVANFAAVDGVTYIGMEEHNGQMAAKFNLESGGYNFELKDGKLLANITDGYVVGETADKGILNSVITYAEDVKESGEYDNAIESVQKSFDAALENAKAVAKNENASQEEIDQAWKILLNEIHKLGFVAGDKTELASLIEAANEINAELDRYVEAGKAEFTTALEAAVAVYEDGDAMQAEVNEAADNLLNAMLNLRYKADKSILEEVLAEASKVDANVYTAESYAALQAAVVEASNVYSNENATQEEVDAAVTRVQTAMDNLIAVDGTPAETPTEDNGTQTGQESTTPKANAAKTGDFAPIAGLAAISLAGIALWITRKKK